MEEYIKGRDCFGGNTKECVDNCSNKTSNCSYQTQFQTQLETQPQAESYYDDLIGWTDITHHIYDQTNKCLEMFPQLYVEEKENKNLYAAEPKGLLELCKYPDHICQRKETYVEMNYKTDNLIRCLEPMWNCKYEEKK